MLTGYVVFVLCTTVAAAFFAFRAWQQQQHPSPEAHNACWLDAIEGASAPPHAPVRSSSARRHAIR